MGSKRITENLRRVHYGQWSPAKTVAALEEKDRSNGAVDTRDVSGLAVELGETSDNENKKGQGRCAADCKESTSQSFGQKTSSNAGDEAKAIEDDVDLQLSVGIGYASMVQHLPEIKCYDIVS